MLSHVNWPPLVLIEIFDIFLQLRTRSSLLESLVNDLREKSREFLSSAATPGTPIDFAPDTNKSESSSGNRFIDTVRKALIARVRSQENNNNNVKKMTNGHSETDPSAVITLFLVLIIIIMMSLPVLCVSQ